VKYSVEFLPAARRDYLALPQLVRRRVDVGLEVLAQDPLGSATVPLRRSLKGRRKCRIGDYRVVYTVYQGAMVVEVVAVGHRSRVYEDAERRE
jgi:mRNA interferase RelE/StbE